MGLDQYAFRINRKPSKEVDFFEELRDPETGNNRPGVEIQEIAYWRKHANLQGWMTKLYAKKGGESADFNVAPLLVTAEDIDELEKTVKAEAYEHATGFFWGASDASDKELDLAFIESARKAFAEGDHIAYYAWY